MDVNYNALLKIGHDLLLALGEDPQRDGLRDTPRRFASYWREFLEYHPGTLDTCFESVMADQMVVVSGIRVWSFCEHHLLPFWCDLAVGYITRGKVLGLSKFARIAHATAHRLQLQERLCEEVSQEVATIAQTEDVAVLARGRHSCMEMRGIRTEGVMISSVMHGLFRDSVNARMEFLNLVGVK